MRRGCTDSTWLALATLTVLEIVLGIDNLVFISVLTSRCEARDARRARQIGLSLAFGDTSGGFRRLIQIVFCLSIAFAASSCFLSFFSFGGGVVI